MKPKTYDAQAFVHYGAYVQKALDTLERRRTGKEKSIQTGWKKLDRALLNGIPYWKIVSICGMSGSGKSTFLQNLIINAIEMNPAEKIEVLSFELEMLPSEQVIRTLSTKLKKSTEDLMSKDEYLSETDMEEVKGVAENLKSLPIFCVDQPGRPEEIRETINKFVRERKIKEENKCLFVTLDFVSLCKGNASDAEKSIIDNLYKHMVESKKQMAADDVKIVYVLLSQLNRDIEKEERKVETGHYPNRNDIYMASSVFVSSDVVIIIHNPNVVSTGLPYYGVDKFPLKDRLDNKDFIYGHIIKNRGGKTSILQFKENFSESKIEET